MLKILYIAQNIPIPGRESNDVIFKIADNLACYGKVEFLHPSEYVPWFFRSVDKYRLQYGLKDWEYNTYHVHVYKYSRLPIKQLAFTFFNNLSSKGKKIIDKISPVDVCHAHYILPDGYLAYLIYKCYGIPYIITVRGSDLRLLQNRGDNSSVFKKAADAIYAARKVIVLNYRLKEFIESRFNVTCDIIPHGIQKTLIAKPLEKKQIDEIRIVAVGSAIEQKNHQWVINFINGYTGEKHLSLTIIGDGPYLDELKRIAGNNKSILFTGRLSNAEVMEHLYKSNIFTLPSINETFGVVYLEAAANFNAIIGHYKDGVWGLFEEGKEMLFARDENDFYDKLESLINQEDLRNNLAYNAWEKVSSQYTWNLITEKYMKSVYEIIKP